MLSITIQVTSEMDVLYGLYQLAIDYTNKLEPEDNTGMIKGLDTRQRLLSRTASSTNIAATLLKKFDSANNIPANEKALVEEKKNLIKDCLLKMRQTESLLMRKMQKKMKNLRGELADITYRRKAAQSYSSAPRAKTFIS